LEKLSAEALFFVKAHQHGSVYQPCDGTCLGASQGQPRQHESRSCRPIRRSGPNWPDRQTIPAFLRTVSKLGREINQPHHQQEYRHCPVTSISTSSGVNLLTSSKPSSQKKPSRRETSANRQEPRPKGPTTAVTCSSLLMNPSTFRVDGGFTWDDPSLNGPSLIGGRQAGCGDTYGYMLTITQDPS
jgi:hypothetical protein